MSSTHLCPTRPARDRCELLGSFAAPCDPTKDSLNSTIRGQPSGADRRTKADQDACVVFFLQAVIDLPTPPSKSQLLDLDGLRTWHDLHKGSAKCGRSDMPNPRGRLTSRRMAYVSSSRPPSAAVMQRQSISKPHAFQPSASRFKTLLGSLVALTVKHAAKDVQAQQHWLLLRNCDM